MRNIGEALVLEFAPFKVQGSTPHGCKQFPALCREISEGVVHWTGVYSARVGLKGPAFKRFPDIKIYIYTGDFLRRCKGVPRSIVVGILSFTHKDTQT
jgi:hypothetical protein